MKRSDFVTIVPALLLSAASLAVALTGCSGSQTAAPPSPATDASTQVTDASPPPSDAATDGQTDDVGLDAGDSMNPLATVPRNGTWTFVPFPDAYCADGTTTGIGVSLTTASDDLAIYLNGGGGCWDEATCSAGCATNMPSGYDETHGTPAWSTFSDLSTFAGTIFDRTDTNNPIRNYNFIHVFYCTGDTHAGSRIDTSFTIRGRDGQQHPMHFLGYQNLIAYLKAMSATFQPSHVFLSGGSAGGFGVYTGYDVVARTFPNAPVYMVDDSGPYLENVYWPPGSDVLAPAWGLETAIPAGCTGCLSNAPDAGMATLAGYLSKTYPNGRMALVTSTQDGHIRERYEMDGGAYQAALGSLATDVLDGLPNWRYYYLAGDTHTVLLGHIADDTPCGTGITSVTTPPGTTCAPTLEQFLNLEFAGPDAGWASATPPPGVPGRMSPPPDGGACMLNQ